jgi:hypothetical protein
MFRWRWMSCSLEHSSPHPILCWPQPTEPGNSRLKRLHPCLPEPEVSMAACISAVTAGLCRTGTVIPGWLPAVPGLKGGLDGWAEQPTWQQLFSPWGMRERERERERERKGLLRTQNEPYLGILGAREHPHKRQPFSTININKSLCYSCVDLKKTPSTANNWKACSWFSLRRGEGAL